MLIDIHKRAIKKYQQVKLERQAEEQKQQEAPWDFVHTRCVFNIYLHKLPFICILDYTDKKPWITFQVQLLLTTSAI